MASQPGTFNVQEFADAGAPLVGGRLYTYSYGTTTQKTAYTDAAGTIPHTYTSDGAGGLYIALNSRGELPAPLYLTSGSYDLALKRSDGSSVWTRRAEGPTDYTASTGASLIGFIQAGTGAVSRTVQAKIRDTVNARDFGAVFDGVTDDTTSIQAAITALQAAGGGRLILPVGTGVISSTLNITASCVSLIGQGEGGNHDTGTTPTAQTVLKWAGAGAGIMVLVAPSGTQCLRENDVTGIFFDGNSSQRAAYGLVVRSCSNSTHKIAGRSCTSALISYESVSGLLEAADCQNNDVWVSGYQQNTGDGTLFACSGNATANFSFNRIHNISGNYKGNGVSVGNSDSNIFYMIHLVAVTGYTGNGVVLQGHATDAGQVARGNKFVLVDPGAGGLYSQGTEAVHPAVQNEVIAYNTGNGAPVPALGLSTDLTWSDLGQPVGLRSRSISATGGSNTISSAKNSLGIFRYFGKSPVISAGGNTVITFPTAFATAALKALATPEGAGVAFYCGLTLTTLTITNAGGVATDFWWEVEGY